MLTACLLAIGNELLNGEIRDINLHTLSRKLTKLGFHIQHAMMARDDPQLLGSALAFLVSVNPDVVICSGGLGPTLDDMTLPVFAQVFHHPLILNINAKKMVEEQYDSLIKLGYLDQYGPKQAVLKMSTLPENAVPLKNPIGTAPGVHMKLGTTEWFLLPGVPQELDAIYETSILPYLHQRFSLRYWAEGAILVHCDDEAELTTTLAEITNSFPQVYVKSLAKPFPAAHLEGIRIIATTNAETSEHAAKTVQDALSLLQTKLIKAGYNVENNHA